MSGNYAAGNSQSYDLTSSVRGSSAGVDAAGSYSYRENRIEPAQDQTVADKISGSKEELDSFAEDVVETVAEDLDVSTEEVDKALEELGMSPFDLLIPQNLVEVAQQLTGEESPADLLVNAQFVDLMQDMNQMGLQLLQVLDAQPGQLEELVAQMDLLEEPVALTEEEAQALLHTQEDEPQSAQAPVLETVGQAAKSAPEDEVQQTPEEPEQDETLPEQVLQKAEETQEFSGEEQTGKGESDGSRSAKNPAEVPTDGSLSQTEVVYQAPEEIAPAAEENSYLSIDTMDLIEQIAEHVRVSVSEGTSSMELQLNPENLGKVYLQVTAKEGVVNATIAASNEAVRAALEAQVADLRQSMNQAGVKVDAIEVTVASHEFERNLEQNADSGRQQGGQEKQTDRRRNLTLSSMDELSGVMTEEEALVAQIMRDNGNSVDLTA
jgi:flagellar hook-length control protein FliK